MNDIEIRALYRALMEPAPDLETANRQRKLAAGAMRDLSVTYTMTYADAATHKQVADLACTVRCGLMEEDLKRRAEHGTAD